MFQKARTTSPNPTEVRSNDIRATQARLLDELASVGAPRDLETGVTADPSDDRVAHLELVDDLSSPPRFRPTRAGRYVITDRSGRPIGSAMGDYVIGFTVSCWEQRWRFPDLDYAKIVVSLEAEARNRAKLRDAS
ncbi:MAG TPA: hypothetical protein VGN19_09595 [Pedococcus sp.]|jgi:hypothetical protein|nr:hypothetical protein [Pedococcus sp.]